jgi:hypothetical protein
MGTRKPDGYGFGQNLKPVMGMSFLMGIDIFHGYGFGTAKPSGFVPVAISTRASHRMYGLALRSGHSSAYLPHAMGGEPNRIHRHRTPQHRPPRIVPWTALSPAGGRVGGEDSTVQYSSEQRRYRHA